VYNPIRRFWAQIPECFTWTYFSFCLAADLGLLESGCRITAIARVVTLCHYQARVVDGSTFMQNVVEVLYYAEAVKQASYSKHWYCGRWTCSIALIMCVVMLIDISPTLSTSLFIKQ